MKTIKRIAALTLALILCAGCFAACGNGNKPQGSGDAKKDIEIAYWNAGLGDQWLKDVIAAFNAKHPEYYVYYGVEWQYCGLVFYLRKSGCL